MSRRTTLAVALLLAGIAVLVVAAWFSFVKGGLPYQDPPTELYIQWLSYHAAGGACAKAGFGLLGAGVLILLVKPVIKRITGRNR